MNVSELIEWLREFPDQEAEVFIVEHTSGSGYYDQGGNCTEEPFNPVQHHCYTDMRNNPFISKDAPYHEKRFLLLGATDQ